MEVPLDRGRKFAAFYIVLHLNLLMFLSEEDVAF